MRDDFDKPTKDILARRVNYHCSNCWTLTSGPQQEPTKAVSIGVAAHISAASPGGPRYDPTLSAMERKSIQNGVWLCQNCAKLIDSDPVRYSIADITQWKVEAEERVRRELAGTKEAPPSKPLIIAYRFTPGTDLSSRDAQYNIMYVNRVLGKQRHEIERYLGKLDEINAINVGSLDSIPEGGEVRWYHYEGYLVSVAYDLSDIAQSIRFEGFEQHQYTFSDYFEIFHRLGISVGPLPDITSDLKMAWKNYHGYYLSMALNKVGGVVNLVRIYRIRQ